MIETGIISRLEMHYNLRPRATEQADARHLPHERVSHFQLVIPFGILVMGIILSLIILPLEVINYTCCNISQPGRESSRQECDSPNVTSEKH